MQLRPIGIIHTAFKEAAGTPVQVSFAKGTRGTVEVFREYQDGLKDLEGFERIWLLYWFHRASPPRLVVTPYLDTQQHGVFSTRAPSRPNPLGISPVRLVQIEGNFLSIAEVDILDGTPVLDTKPYVLQFDCFRVRKCGWLGKPPRRPLPADDRFEKD